MLLAQFAGAARAAVVVQWTFDAPLDPPDPPNVQGTTEPLIDANGGAAFTRSNNVPIVFFGGNPGPTAEDKAAASDKWNASGNYFEIAFNTVGFTGVHVYFDLRRSSTGPVNLKFSHGATGPNGPFVEMPLPMAANTSWQSFFVDLSGKAALDDNPDVVLRIVGFDATNSAGTLRIDDLIVTDAPLSTPPIAIDRMILTRLNTPTAPFDLLGVGEGLELGFTITALPHFGTLKDNGQVIASTPHVVVGQLVYVPTTGWSGVDAFSFRAFDEDDPSNVSEEAVQEIGAQTNVVVISELMHSPGKAGFPQDQKTFEYVEIFNIGAAPVALTRIDTRAEQDVDTSSNLAGAVIQPGEFRIIAAGGVGPGSDDELICEWGLSEGDVIRVPADAYETTFFGGRLQLFGAGDVLLDGVDLRLDGFPISVDGSSLAINDDFLFGGPLDTASNDGFLPWKYTGFDNSEGIRASYSGINLGSPGFVPAGLNEDYDPGPPCPGYAPAACCIPNGACADVRASQCDEVGGSWQGDGVDCADVEPCPQPAVGACCLATGACLDTNAYDCAALYGAYVGDGIACDAAQCDATVPLAFNEIEYDQSGVDGLEYVELIGTPGRDLTGWRLIPYDGHPSGLRPYDDIALTAVPADGLLVIGAADVPDVDIAAFGVNGVENGSPDGMVIVDDAGNVVELIAYEGSFTADPDPQIGGPAAGMFFPDIGVADAATSDPADDVSLQRLPDIVGDWQATTDDGLGPDGTPGRANATPLPATTGACCLPNGQCAEGVREDDCLSANGEFRGNGTFCDGSCVVLVGACCLPDADCTETVESQCDNEGGLFYGAGTLCADVEPCPPPISGACCLPIGDCEVLPAIECAARHGEFAGAGAACTGPSAPVCDDSQTLVRINEVLADDDGPDDEEFVELFGPPFITVHGLALVFIDGDIDGALGEIEAVWALDDLWLSDGGRFVIGDVATPNVDVTVGEFNTMSNGTVTVLLIAGYDPMQYPAGWDIDGDDDGLPDPGVDLGLILDDVGLADGGYDPDLPDSDILYLGATPFGPFDGAAPLGGARFEDGFDTDSACDFCAIGDDQSAATPGEPNGCIVLHCPPIVAATSTAQHFEAGELQIAIDIAATLADGSDAVTTETRDGGVGRLRVTFASPLPSSVQDLDDASVVITSDPPGAGDVFVDSNLDQENKRLVLDFCPPLDDGYVYHIVMAQEVTPTLQDRDVVVRSLIGNVVADGGPQRVNALDIGLGDGIRGHFLPAGQLVDDANAKYDVNLNGAVNALDIAYVRIVGGVWGNSAP